MLKVIAGLILAALISISFIFPTVSAQEVQVDLAIAACESGGQVYGQKDYTAVNYAWPRSSATGAYQFLDTTWRYTILVYAPHLTQWANHLAKDAPPSVQDEVFWALYNAEGISHWNESRHCWSKWVYGTTPAPSTPTPVPEPTVNGWFPPIEFLEANDVEEKIPQPEISFVC